MRAREDGVGAECERARRQIGVEAELRAPRLINDQRHTGGVRDLNAAGDIGRQPVVGRRDDERCSYLGMLGQQRGELGRLDSERNSQLAVVLRFDEDWIAAAEDEAIDD